MATVVYAVLTWSLVRETKRLRQASTDPNVALFLDVPHYTHIVEVVVKNVGAGPAYDVTFEFDRDARDVDGDSLQNLSYFKGIQYFPPDHSMRTMIGTAFTMLDNPGFEPVKVTVRYLNSRGSTFTESFALDPKVFEGTVISGGSPTKSVTDALKTMTAAINKVSAALDRPRQPKPIQSQHAPGHRRDSAQ